MRLERELESKLRRRRVKQQLNKGNKLNLFSANKKTDDDDDDDDCEESGTTKRSKLAKQVARRSNRFFANRVLFGLTAAVGVAAVTVYAMNTNKGEPQELLSKVFHHFLNYRNF